MKPSATSPSMTDAEMVKAVRRWLDKGKEAEMETRWLRRACFLAEQFIQQKEDSGVLRDKATASETRVPIAQEFAEFIGRLSDLAHTSSFWLEKPYGNRLYYGIGAGDYIAKDVLHAFLHALKATPSATRSTIRPMPPKTNSGILCSRCGASVEHTQEECDAWTTPSATRSNFSLRHLQAHLPWTIPYSAEFEFSADANGLRRVGHDVLHVMKSLGRIAAEVEASDHGRPRKLTGDALAKEAADLVLCALHIARCEGFDLQDAVVTNSEARNAAQIQPEYVHSSPGGKDV